VKVSGSVFESVEVAAKLMFPPTGTVLPVAAGDCAHVGGEFLTTVQDCVVVEPPLVAVAVRTFEELSDDDRMD